MGNIWRHTHLMGLLLFVGACTPQQSKDTVQTSDPLTVATVEADRFFTIDTLVSVVTWIGSKPTGKHNGIISISGGQLGLKDGFPINGKVTIDLRSIEIRDLTSGSEEYQRLLKHLHSEDFFHTDSFPTAIFELVQILPYDTTQASTDKIEHPSPFAPANSSAFQVENPTHLISGNLTLRGVTKSITFPAKMVVFNGELLAEAKFNIDRTDWNVQYSNENSALDKAKDKFIYNTVNVGFSLRAMETVVE